MLLKMLRTQKTAIGMLRAGVAYDFDDKDPRQAAIAKRLLENKLAEKTTAKKLAEAAQTIAAQQAAAQADADNPTGTPSAILVADMEKLKEVAEKAVGDAQAAQKAAEEKLQAAENQAADLQAKLDAATAPAKGA